MKIQPVQNQEFRHQAVGMQEAHKISAGVEFKQVNTGKQQKRRRESWGATKPLHSITENIIRTTHGARVVAEEREIHRLSPQGTGLCRKEGGCILCDWVMAVTKGQKESVLFMKPGLQ